MTPETAKRRYSFLLDGEGFREVTIGANRAVVFAFEKDKEFLFAIGFYDKAEQSVWTFRQWETEFDEYRPIWDINEIPLWLQELYQKASETKRETEKMKKVLSEQ